MTAEKLLDRALALMFSDSSEKAEITNSFIAVLNILLAENFAAENGIRGESDPLKEPQVVTSLSDKIVYSDRILAFLPFGLAGTLMAEDDINIATQYKSHYEAERAGCVTAKFESVVDCYD